MFNVYQQLTPDTQEMALYVSFDDLESANAQALELFNISGLATTVEEEIGGMSRIVTINKQEQTNA